MCFNGQKKTHRWGGHIELLQGNNYENCNFYFTNILVLNILRDTNKPTKNRLLGNHPDLCPVSMLKSCHTSFPKTQQEDNNKEGQGSTAKTY